MNANLNRHSSKNGRAGSGAWLTGAALIISAALAITVAVRNAPARPAAEPPSRAQSVPDANTKAVLDYLQVHAAVDTSPVQVAPDANTKAVMDYLRAHGYGQPSTVQIVPDANTKAVLDYLRAHGANVQ